MCKIIKDLSKENEPVFSPLTWVLMVSALGILIFILMLFGLMIMF